MTNMMDMVKVILIMQAFFSLTITLTAYALPSDMRVYVDEFAFTGGATDIPGMASTVQGNLDNQRDIPVIEVGALIFYSGVILLDLVMNFLFAIPIMIGMFINGLLMLFSVDSYVWATIELFTASLMIILYIVSAIQMIASYRGRGAIV